MPLPGRRTILGCLPKSMMVAVPTHLWAVIKADTQFQQKEDAAHDRRHPLNQLFGSVLVHFQQDLKQLFLLFGCLGRKKSITLERDISAAIILSTQLLKQFGHREVECGGNLLNAFNGGILFATFQLTDICGVSAGHLCQLLLTEPGSCPVISDSLTNSFCDFTHRRNTPFLRYI